MKAHHRAGPITSWGYAGLLVALLLAWGLRLYRVADKPVWWDEGWSVWLARLDPVSIAIRTASDEHPPLHYWFLHVWNGLAGDDAAAVRFTSIAFGVLTVALLYRFAADLAGPRVALLAALLLALSRFHITWSQEIKMYSPGILLALLSCFAFVRLWRTGRRRYAALWAVSTWAVVMTLYLGVLVAASQGAVALLALIRSGSMGKVRPRTAFLLAGGVALAWVPWALVYRQYAYPFEALDTFDLGTALRLYATVLPLGISTEIARLRFTLGAAGFGVLAFAGAVWGLRRTGLWQLPLIAVGSVPLALLAASLPEQAFYQPKVSERYMVLFLPFYLLLVAAGVAAVAARLGRAAVVVGAVTVAGMITMLPEYYQERRPSHEAPALAYALASQMQPGDTVVLNSDKDWPVYAYYLPLPEERWLRIPHGAVMSPAEADHWLTKIRGREGAVWLVTDASAARTDAHGDVRRWLEDRFSNAGEWRFTSAQLTLYARDDVRVLGVLPSRPPGLAAAPVLTFEGMTLDGVGHPPRTMRPGETAYLFSAWETGNEPAGRHRARVRITNQQTGESRTRPWEPLVTAEPEPDLQGGETVLAKHLLAVGPSQPAGTYDVVLEVEQDQQRAEVPVGTVEVVSPLTAPPAEAGGPRLASVGGVAALVGNVSLPGSARPGDYVDAVLRWESLAESPANYTVFVHLVGPDGIVWGSGDGQPGDGTLPMTGWTPGDVLEDAHRMWLPAETPPGQYRLYVGLYDDQTGERLAAANANGVRFDGDEVPVAEMTVVGP